MPVSEPPATLASTEPTPILSLVIPLYRSSDSVEALISRLETLAVPGPWELVLVDDGSPDDTVARLRRRLKTSPLQGVLIRHGRNFGEHQAVLTGYRHARKKACGYGTKP
jgi:glycosyltransferase involved in cell wall biosynthesis